MVCLAAPFLPTPIKKRLASMQARHCLGAHGFRIHGITVDGMQGNQADIVEAVIVDMCAKQASGKF
jgi:hypothetical protein